MAKRATLGSVLGRRRRAGGTLARSSLAALVVFLAAGALPSAAEVAESDVKAQFVERFTRFVTWPTEDPATPFVIGVLGDDALRASLEDLASRTRFRGRPAEVRALADPADAAACQLVFIAGSRRDDLDRLLATVAGKPVLTVGDGDGFGRQGVAVNFYREGGYLRFEVNEAAASAAGLRISADLLAVARIVR